MTELSLKQKIVADVESREAPFGMSTKFIAIDGRTLAGKSTLALKMLEWFDGARVVIATDDFGTSKKPFDWETKAIEQVFEPLRYNHVANYERYDNKWVGVAPGGTVILEGTGALQTQIRPYLTYSIWVNGPEVSRVQSGRFIEEANTELKARMEEWVKAEDAYIKHYDPQAAADLEVDGTKEYA